MNGQKKNIIKINEAQLKQIISESVKMVLNESLNNYPRTNHFDATKSDYWKAHHSYDDNRADRASSWMSKHYDLEEENEDDIDYDVDYNGEEDDWRSEEPSQNSVQTIMSNIQQKCAQNGVTFKNLGDNEFGVISGNQGCTMVASFLKSMESNGTIYKTGGEILPNDVLRVKYRIIKG